MRKEARMNNSFLLKGYFTKVVSNGGHLSALFTTKKGSQVPEYYLYLPEQQRDISYDAFQKAYAKYQNFLNWNTYLEVEGTAEVGKTATGMPKVEVKSVKDYKEVKREKAVEILKEHFESKEISTLEALHLAGQELIAVMAAAEAAEKKWLLAIIGRAGEKAKMCIHEYTNNKYYYLGLEGKPRISFSSEISREDLYKKIIEYGEMKRQGTAKQSLLCKKYKEENEE